MSKNKYQGIDPYVANQVRYHARSLMRHSAIHGVEVEDIEQEMMLDYLSRSQAFDPEKAKWSTFIDRILNHKCASIIEAAKAQKRGSGIREFSLDAWLEDKDGENDALRDEQPYSQAHYDVVCQKYGDRAALDKYDTIFIDSITVAGRLGFNWCKGQPQAFSEKTGKPDTRGAYALHGQEMIAWLTHLQHTRGKNIWFVGILDEKIDDFNRRFFQPQIEGSKTALELPGIVDQVITMAEMVTPEGKSFRAFICHPQPGRQKRAAPGVLQCG